MARIVLGVGASHGPLNSLDALQWVERGEQDKRAAKLNTLDGRFLTYAELVAERGEPYADESGLSKLTEQSEEVQACLRHLEAEIRARKPDVAIVIGDDQAELFSLHNMPSVSVFYGDVIDMHEADAEFSGPFWKSVIEDYAMDGGRKFPAYPAFARELIERLIDKGVDVAASAGVEPSGERGFGHAFGFIGKRLLGNPPIPMIPILLNTFYPPNVLTPRRCYEVGQVLRVAIEESKTDLDVAIIASGGLSHFLCEESLDRCVLTALEQRDQATLAALPRAALTWGSSEILNWIMAGGALEGLRMNWRSYIPVRRTPAGTGIGMAFATWS